MKCTSMKLSSRLDQTRKIWKENTTPGFAGEEGHRPKTMKDTTLAITNINLPDNIQGFNTGASLDRWAKKRSRLKSGKVPKSPTEFDKDFCYETLETDLSVFLKEEELTKSPDGSLDNLEYEVHTDIEKLLKVQEQEQEPDEDNEQKRKKKKRSKDNKKKKKTKTIRFSKSPSPQTEQVIRVDVTSNVSSDEDKRRAGEMSKVVEDGKSEMIDDKRKELKRNLIEGAAEMCDEEFIVRCKQLALKQRRRL